MDEKIRFNTISSETFEASLDEYPEIVASNLSNLDKQRYQEIPDLVSQRKADGKAYLTKDEVAILVDWKLSHGTFRPTLRKLIQQNSEDDVLETTVSGFNIESLDKALQTMTKLKGVGPATASLFLSVNDPQTVPFFSDELFRWCFWEDKPNSRWDRKIKYAAKEYTALAGKVAELQARLGGQHGPTFSATNVEKVAYVLGKGAYEPTAESVQPEAARSVSKPQPRVKRGISTEPSEDRRSSKRARASQTDTATTSVGQKGQSRTTRPKRASASTNS